MEDNSGETTERSEQTTDTPKAIKLEAYQKRIEKPWGYEIHWVPEGVPYMGKLLFINEGARLSLQAHDTKLESWFVVSGRAAVVWENEAGELVQTELLPGQGYSIQVGQKHRLVGITDTEVMEVSTPEEGTTYRYEDDYQRPDETPEQRRLERNE
jgi:mannose-6-phosphate isomerase-like protein (cupin superfamily)